VKLSRRDFLKVTGATAGGAAALSAFPGGAAAGGTSSETFELHKQIGEQTTICPYDASGCGFIVAAEGGRVVNVEGDPEHPINAGANCSKGAALAQLNTVDGEPNPRRLTKPLRRAPGGNDWEEISWEDALDRIAANIRDTRNNTFVETETISGEEYTVNRCDGIASVGGAALDNEECYLLVKMLRTLGVCYVEHQARI
jgi:formate dehydrogenase major subunit